MSLILRVHVPIRTVSETNAREHPMKRHRRRKGQRHSVLTACIAEGRRQGIERPKLPALAVVLTRVAPRRLDDDNLAGALKATRDAVADWLGVDDGDERVRWVCKQERGRPREYAVRVEVYG